MTTMIPSTKSSTTDAQSPDAPQRLAARTPE